MATKMNRAIFPVLRSTINTKLAPPERLSWEEGQRLYKEYAKRELNKISKERLIAQVLREGSLSDLLDKDACSFREQHDTNAPLREELLAEVNKAELLYLAGDNTAVLKLIEKLDSI